MAYFSPCGKVEHTASRSLPRICGSTLQLHTWTPQICTILVFCNVGFIILPVRPNKAHKDRFRIIVDSDYQSILIPCDIENDPIALENAGRPMLNLYICRGCPLRMFSFVVPCLQRSLGILTRWPLVKLDQGFSFDYMHNLICSQKYVNIKVPYKGTYLTLDTDYAALYFINAAAFMKWKH